MGTLSNYEEFVRTRSTVAEDGRKYAALGLSGESGEVFEEVINFLLAVTKANESIKKFLRNNDKEKYREKIKSELGDVFFYATKCGQDLDLTIKEILQGNVDKIEGRIKVGLLKG
ncbi:MAG: MazG nucleotide pyrophosphohydrolase domain-containing protein [Candidatus Obscuribacterales bacterium]